MGHGDWDSQKWDSYSTTTIRGKSTSAIYTAKTVKNDYDVKGIKIRESCDSADHPNSNAIIIGLDVTGSMSNVLQVVAEKCGLTVEEIINRKPISDPQVMFCAVGDSAYGGHGDRHPLQATQFESDIRIATQLTDLYFERGGGGNGFESYPLVWYFAAKHTDIDCFNKRGKKGFIFTIGDDGVPDTIGKEEIERVFGEYPEKDIDVKELLAEVNRKYEVFHMIIKEGGSFEDSQIDEWQRLLGERAIPVEDYTMIPEIIVSILETMVGKDKKDVIGSWDGTTAVVVEKAISGLTSKTVKDGAIVHF